MRTTIGVIAFISGLLLGIAITMVWATKNIDAAVGRTLDAAEGQILAACDARVSEAITLTAELAVAETSKVWRPLLDQCNSGWSDSLSDQVDNLEWWKEVSVALSRTHWFVSGMTDQEAQDFVFCMIGRASPFENCLQMLEDGRR